MKDLKSKIEEFINSPDYPENLRRNVTAEYHPDKFTDPEMKQEAHELIYETNQDCDEIINNWSWSRI